MRRFRLAHYLKTSLWVIPLLLIIVGVALSLITTSIDDGDLVPRSVSGDPVAALQILYLIAFAMLTLTGLVLSLLVVAVQMAMGTFSPRIVRQILQDRPSQLTIGLFAGTFAHALLSMREVQTTPGDGFVPGLAVVVAIVLVLGCVAALIWYLNHIGQSLRTAALVGWVAKDTVRTLDRAYPDHGEQWDLGPELLAAPRSGVIFKVDHSRLVELARREHCCFELLWAIGDFVPVGSALIRVDGDPAGLTAKRVVACVALGPERTLNQDVAYGIRLLVDIAGRSLSAGPFADPTTAVQAVDRLHDILRQLAARPLHTGRYHDADGELRLVTPSLQWDGFVRVAFDEIRQAGAGSPQLTRRLRAALDDLLTVVPADRRPALERQQALLEESASAAGALATDRATATIPDPAGIGSAVELAGPGAGEHRSL